MTFQDFAYHMWPCWLMGIIMLLVVLKSSYQNIVRIEKKPIFKWLVILGLVTAFRMGCFYYFLHSGDSAAKEKLSAVNSIPWTGALFVFWEDFCHSMPLVILSMMFSSKWLAPIRLIALLVVMVAFGIGHIYQGVFASILLSFYILLSMKMGKKYGFGTVAICHTLYDLCTIFTVKWMLSLL